MLAKVAAISFAAAAGAPPVAGNVPVGPGAGATGVGVAAGVGVVGCPLSLAPSTATGIGGATSDACAGNP
eukprot:6737154-Pyramimonas_sp.AAC.1